MLGAGASLAAPASRPLFAWVRDTLMATLELELDPRAVNRLAPEALLSRLAAAGVDIDGELRRILGGGRPNALHAMAAELLARGGAVWTTNFDELVEAAASDAGISYHRLLPDADPSCACQKGHLVKPHGTLSAERVLARSEQVMAPLQPAWAHRLVTDLRDTDLALVGYRGADLDLRPALRTALHEASRAVWFVCEDDEPDLTRRFADPLAAGDLALAISERPDLAALEWGRDRGLTAEISDELLADAREEPQPEKARAAYRPSDLSRARVLDDFGRPLEARRLYAWALRRGPRRRGAAGALYSSGLIHGAPWRGVALAALNLACALPLRWGWPHRQRLPYLTWNVPPHERLPKLERSLASAGDRPALLLSAANAAKEVAPRRAIELGERALSNALEAEDPADAAWAAFILSFAYRWLGDLAKASEYARQLADGYDALAGPVWIAWGYFELAANAALSAEIERAQQAVAVAVEVFSGAGSIFEFDGWCAALTIARLAGDSDGQERALSRARELRGRGPLRKRFTNEVLLAEEAELARADERLDDAERMYAELAQSGTVAQEMLGLLGLGEVERQRSQAPEIARKALRRSVALDFGYGQVHAAITLGLSGETSPEEAERQIDASRFRPPTREDEQGLLRYCQGPDPEKHLLYFP